MGKCSNTKKTSLFPTFHLLILIIRVQYNPPLPLQNAICLPRGDGEGRPRGSYLMEGKGKGAAGLYLHEL